jgi:hypothetical protein
MDAERFEQLTDTELDELEQNGARGDAAAVRVLLPRVLAELRQNRRLEREFSQPETPEELRTLAKLSRPAEEFLADAERRAQRRKGTIKIK